MDGSRSAVLARQADRHQRAAELLAELDVVDRWRRVGQPYLCGAYAYGLLVALDIDIEIFGSLDVEAGFAVVAGIASRAGVRKVTYINAVDDEDAGLGWEVVCADRTGARWRVQMWLLPIDYAGPRSADLVAPMRARLDAATRCSILRIKEHLVATATAYRSIDVYRAVLDHGVAGPDEYGRWTQRHASTGLIAWSPELVGSATSGRASRSPAAPTRSAASGR
jgi:hypothetical protein